METAVTGLEKRLKNLVPFKPGEHGTKRSKRFTELRGMLVADLGGGDLSPLDNVLLDQAANLLAKAERPGLSATDAVRTVNGAMRILSKLQAGRKLREQEVDDDDADLAAREQAEAKARRAAELAADDAQSVNEEGTP